MTRDNGQFNCPVQGGESAGLLLEFMDRRLAPDVSAQLERHILACDECRRVVDAQRSVWEALEDWEPERISSDFDHRLFARLDEEDRRSRGLLAAARHALGRMFQSIPLRPAIPVAAMCVLVMGVFLYQRPIGVDPSEAPATEAVAVDLEQVETTLADIDMLQQLGVGQADESSAKQSL